MPAVAFVSLVNDRAQFEACQASLRAIATPFPQWLMVEPNLRGWNAAQGLNHGIEQLDAEWIVCVHQDVLFPADFWQRLNARSLAPRTTSARSAENAASPSRDDAEPAHRRRGRGASTRAAAPACPPDEPWYRLDSTRRRTHNARIRGSLEDPGA